MCAREKENVVDLMCGDDFFKLCQCTVRNTWPRTSCTNPVVPAPLGAVSLRVE